MNTYRELRVLMKGQLKGNFIRLFLYLSIMTIGFMLVNESLMMLLGAKSATYSIVSFFLALINILINAGLAFLFLRYARGENFQMEDVKFALKQAVYLIATGILLSILRYMMSIVCVFLGVLPILYIIAYAIVYLFFIAWNIISNYGIFDGNVKFSELMVGSLQILVKNMGPFLLMGLLFIVWFGAGQLVVPAISEVLLETNDYAGAVLLSIIEGSKISMGTACSITAVNLVYFGVQFILLIPIYMFCANIYERSKELYMPSGTRFVANVKKIGKR